jgi:hypothetical protein
VDRHYDAWAVEMYGPTADEQAQPGFAVELLRVTEEVADWASTLPAGLLTLTPALRPWHF